MELLYNIDFKRRKELVRALRATTSDLQMGFEYWSDFQAIVQSDLKGYPPPQRANISPITAFTDMEVTPPIKHY